MFVEPEGGSSDEHHQQHHHVHQQVLKVPQNILKLNVRRRKEIQNFHDH